MKSYVGSKLAVLVKLIIGIVILSANLGIAHAGKIYIGTNNAKLYTYDTRTKTPTAIGSTGVTMYDIAFDPNGQLWGIGNGYYLYKINVITGVSTFVGNLGVFANALVSGNDGILYAAGRSSFYTVDKTTGAASFIGNMGFTSSGDLEFSGSGKLYLMAEGGDQLVQINPADGSGTMVGSTGVRALYGLAFTDGVMFGIANDDVYTLNLTTGVASLYDNNISINGATYGASSPITNRFLAFPLDCSTPNCLGGILYTRGAYTAKSVVSVVDHSMRKNDNGTYPYGKVRYPSGVKGLDGIVLAWTGEKGQGTAVSQGCYPQVYPQVGGSFKIGGTYVSGGTDVNGKECSLKHLNYDDHPGYDYKADYGTPVKAAASGIVVTIDGEKCFKNNLPGTCAKWGAVGIDHKNGYISQYLHMSSISVNSGDKISKGQVIGYSGYTGLPSVDSSHLHFEILKKVANKYFTVDPYGWSASCQSDPMYLWTGICNVRLWK